MRRISAFNRPALYSALPTKQQSSPLLCPAKLLTLLFYVTLFQKMLHCHTNKPASKNNNCSFREPGTTGKYNNDNVLRKEVTDFTENIVLQQSSSWQIDVTVMQTLDEWILDNLHKHAEVEVRDIFLRTDSCLGNCFECWLIVLLIAA